jgi:predicted nucleic acid-binding protein
LEYEEIFNEFWGFDVANNLLGLILTADNTSLHAVYYNFYLVEGDADDNKFSDAYLVANADILVSNDRELLALNKNEYPLINVMTLEEFMLRISEESESEKVR